jgi:hypothetical protein
MIMELAAKYGINRLGVWREDSSRGNGGGEPHEIAFGNIVR